MIRIILTTLSMYIITHAFVFVVLPVAILISYIDRERIPALKRWFVRSLFAIVGKELKVAGYDNLNPRQPYLIIANYPSFYAGFALIGTFPDAAVVAHAFTKNVPLLGQVLRRLGAIFVQPGRGGKGAKAIDLRLSEGLGKTSVIILPEGARTPDGDIKRFRRGFIRILRQTTLDLLPVTFNELYRLKPVKRLCVDPYAQPEMVIHPPVANELAQRMSDKELLSEAYTTISSVYRP
jgi:1-acyl-sn-glycerol-3-phosphate acyltransferase